LSKTNINYLQLGRSIIELQPVDPNNGCSIFNLCSKKKRKVQKGVMAYDGEDYFPEEFMHKHNEFTREEDLIGGGNKKDKQPVQSFINANN
jgi:hypothetical protein